jgi:hypothetical protein
MLLAPGVDAAGVYVPMTRGRDTNTLHVVAVDQQDARQQFIEAMTREAGDRGLDTAKEALATQIRGLDLTDDNRSPSVRLIDDLKTRTPDLGPAEAAFRQKWMGVLDQRVQELERRERVIQAAGQRKQWAEDWVASGKTTPTEARAAVTDATAERDAAQKALEAVRRDQQRHLADVQSGTSRELWQEITRARLAEEAVVRANVFQKLSARNTSREVTADVEQKIGSPLPQPQDRGDWVQNRARDAMKAAQTDAAPALDAATNRVTAAERALTERADTHKRVTAEWAQVVDRRKDPTAGLSPEVQRAQRASQAAPSARPATTKAQDPLDRYVTRDQRETFAARDLPQARERVERTSRYIDRFDQATPEQRVGMIERAATRAAEQAKTAEAKVREARQQAERTRRSYTPPHLGDRDRGHDLER